MLLRKFEISLSRKVILPAHMQIGCLSAFQTSLHTCISATSFLLVNFIVDQREMMATIQVVYWDKEEL